MRFISVPSGIENGGMIREQPLTLPHSLPGKVCAEFQGALRGGELSGFDRIDLSDFVEIFHTRRHKCTSGCRKICTPDCQEDSVQSCAPQSNPNQV
jgi:hypothetical protein